MFGKKAREKERKQGRLVLALLIFSAALALLVWNEGRAVKTARSLAEGAEAIRPVSPESVDPAHDRQLIHLSGTVSPVEGAYDPELGLRFPQALKIRREVQMYQWKGRRRGKGDEAPYEYRRVWSNFPIDSEEYSPEHRNPPFLLRSRAFPAEIIRLGAFTLSTALTKQLPTSDKLLLTSSHLKSLEKSLRERAVLYKGGLYIAAHGRPQPEQPAIGDSLIWVYAAVSQTVSIIAQQENDRLVPYSSRAGGTLAILKPGRRAASQMIRQAQESNLSLSWIYRFLGFFLLLGGFQLLPLSPAGFLGRIPGLKDFSKGGDRSLSVLLALVLALLIIGLASLVFRPLVGLYSGIGLVLILLLGRGYFQKHGQRRAFRELRTRVLKLAMARGGRLTITEVIVACETDPKTARDALESLVQDGIAGMDVDDTGVMIYTFSLAE